MRFKFKSLVLSLVLLCSLTPVVVFTPGCSLFSEVAPGNDAVVVNSERVAILSFTMVDTFLEWEMLNRAVVPQEVTAAADGIRDEFPPAYNGLRSATKAYKFNRTAENKASVKTAIGVAQSILNTIATYLPPAVKSAAEAKAATITTPPAEATVSKLK